MQQIYTARLIICMFVALASCYNPYAELSALQLQYNNYLMHIQLPCYAFLTVANASLHGSLKTRQAMQHVLCMTSHSNNVKQCLRGFPL